MKSLELPTYKEWKSEFEENDEYSRNRDYEQWKLDNKRLSFDEICDAKIQEDNERKTSLLSMESAKKMANAILAHDSPENKFKMNQSEIIMYLYVTVNSNNDETIYREFLLAKYRQHLEHKTHMFKWNLNIDASQASAEE